MTPKRNHTLSSVERQATIHELLQEKMRLAIRHTLVTILEEEVENFIHTSRTLPTDTEPKRLSQRTLRARFGHHNGRSRGFAGPTHA